MTICYVFLHLCKENARVFNKNFYTYMYKVIIIVGFGCKIVDPGYTYMYHKSKVN